MKLYLNHHTYHYAAEQMLLTLFPGERPEYPAGPPHKMEDGAVLSLFQGAQWATATAELTWKGQRFRGLCRCRTDQLTDALTADRALQRILKQAFYRAGTKALGQEPPWGALTGVRPVKLPTRVLRQGGTPAQAARELTQRYRVSPRRAELAVDCAEASLALDRTLGPDEVSLYIGIPFCPTRCAYCSFVSADVGRALKLVAPYLELLLREVARTAAALARTGLSVKTIYMGGGTPTTLSAQQMDRLLGAIEELDLSRCAEFTVEAGRPDTITREKLEVLRRHRVDRISINPQTMQDPVLAAVGRRHSAQDIRAAYAMAREMGFQCINMDLIAGLPLDSAAGFCASLTELLALGPENITVHTLALKKGARLMEEGGPLPSGEEVSRMLEFSMDALRGAGYRPYYLYRQKYMSGGFENVSWCLPGTENRYNIVMMEELQSVLSLGAGGITKLVDRRQGKILRLSNPKYPHDYLAMADKVLDQKDEIEMFYREDSPIWPINCKRSTEESS